VGKVECTWRIKIKMVKWEGKGRRKRVPGQAHSMDINSKIQFCISRAFCIVSA
jgi:hypothetical protein